MANDRLAALDRETAVMKERATTASEKVRLLTTFLVESMDRDALDTVLTEVKAEVYPPVKDGESK